MPEIHLPDALAQLPTTVWWTVGGLVVLPLLLRVLAFRTLRNQVFRPGGVSLAEPRKIPVHQRPVLEEADRQLQALGFSYWGTLRDLGQMGEAHARWWLVYHHASPPTLARISVSHDATRLTECDMFLSSWRKSDSKYIDTHPQPVPRAIPTADDTIADGRAFTSLAEQWQHHQAKVKPMGEAVAFPDAQAWLKRADEQGRGDLNRLAALGVVKPGREEETFRLSWRAAWRSACEGVKNTKLLAVSKSKPEPAFPSSILAELDFDHWRREQAKKASAPGMSTMSKLIMLALSIAISAWALKGGKLDAAAVIGILAVILVHELGHFLAMLVFGYRNLNILFIPFFGAVATSTKKPDVAAWKGIFIVLAGPLPGLVAGCAAMYFDGWGLPWLSGPARFAVVINALNLLPVLPLDGGHLLRLAIQARWPRLQALFQTLSAIGMILFGFVGGKFLTYLGVMQLIRAGLPWFIASIVSREHRSIRPVNGSREPHSEEDAQRRALQAIWAHPKYRRQNSVNRLAIAQQIADQLRARRAGFFAAFTAFAACMIVFWSPFAAWFGLGMYADRRITQVLRENAAAGVPASPTQAQKDPLCQPDPVHVKRWTALMNVVATVEADSPVLKDLDALNAQAEADHIAESRREMRRDKDKPSAAAKPDDLLARKSASLNAFHPPLPETMPEALGRFVADARNALLAEPKDVSQAAKKITDDFNLDPLALLRRDARRHLKAGRLEEWKADVIACARGAECAPTQTAAECYFRTNVVEQLLAIIEEAWPQLAEQPDKAFLDELVQRLPTPDDLMRRRALALFTQPAESATLDVVVSDDEVLPELENMKGFTAWLQRSPPAKLILLESLQQRRKLWETMHSKRPVDWVALGAQLSGSLTPAAFMVVPPEAAAVHSVGYSLASQDRSLRPSWQLFRMAMNLQEPTLKSSQLASNCTRKKLADGTEALVLTPPKSQTPDNDVMQALLAPQPVMWRLPK